MKRSSLNLALLKAASVAMLSACSSSPGNRPRPAPDPVIETRTITRLICPDELQLDLPARVATPADAVIEGNEAGMRVIAELYARNDLMDARFRDAKAQCPHG